MKQLFVFIVYIKFIGQLCSPSFVSASCNLTVLQSQKGDIQTPGYPSNYPANCDCSWKIVVSSGSRITLQFLDFLLEKSFGCTSDKVEVYDGMDSNAYMIGRYCGRFNPFAVMSTSNALFVVFKSDKTNNFQGFRSSYIATAGISTQPLQSTRPPTTKAQTAPTKSVSLLLFFTRKLKNETVFVGNRRHTLKCDIGYTNSYTNVSWTKNGKSMEETNNIIFKRPQHHKFRLRIRHITEQDSGHYGCHVSDDSGNSIHTYGILHVKEGLFKKPKITRSPLNVAAVKESKVELSCAAVGLPKPKIRWKIDGKYVTENSREENATVYLTLILMKNITITCEARNSEGKDSKTAVVSVAKSRKPRIIRAPTNRTAEVGDEVTLLCTATGLPRPVMRWEVDEKYYIDKSQDENGTIYHTLKVQKRTTVACKAQNKLGVDSRVAVISLLPSVLAQKNQIGPLEKTQLIILMTGVGALCVLVVVVIFLQRRRRRTAKFKMPQEVKSDQLLQNPMFEEQSSDNRSSNNPQIEKWELPRNSIEFVKDLEDGPITRTFLGHINHPTRGQQEELIMVKVLKETSPSVIIRENFESETLALTTYSHPNVQSLLGVCAIGNPLCLVFEYSDYRNLNHYLRDCDSPSNYVLRQRSDTNRSDDNAFKLSSLDLIYMAKQIAAGMEYLTEEDHIHKQLCTMHCLVGNTLHVKISSIGISWSYPSTNYYLLDTNDREHYPIRWYPPETIQFGAFSEDTDIWSFGVLLWELHSFGLEPYYGMSNDEVISLVREGDVLPCPKDCSQDVYVLMRECWNLIPNDRPRFSIIHQRISTIYSPIPV